MIRELLSKLVAGLCIVALVVLAVAATVDPARAVSSRDAKRGDIAQSSIAGPPVIAIVSIRNQRISLYDANGGSMRARVSSGQTGYETPVGTYSILQKKEEHYSNLYDDASMPFMQRITWSGIALHAGALPGYPASHGCVRMPYNFAEQIFGLTRIGMRVIVARDDVAPVEITHPLLLKPKPIGEVAVATQTAHEPEESGPDNDTSLQPDVRNWPARQKLLEALKSIAEVKSAEARAAAAHADRLKLEAKKKTSERAKVAKTLRVAQFAMRKAEGKVASAERALAAAKSPAAIKNAEDAKTKAMTVVAEVDAKFAAATGPAQAAEEALARAIEEAGAAEAAKAAAVNAAKEADRKTLPVSIFISMKTQRVYVRQGYEPVFDASVTISDPDKPLGTHIYTAVDYANHGDDVRWNVVSIGRPSLESDPASDRHRLRTDKGSEPAPTDLVAAAVALDRVTIPPDVIARVSTFVWPGSSLIISDEEMSKETGRATDFVVLISGEPQGGIKKRRRQPDNFYRYDPYDPYFRYDRPRRSPRYRGGSPFFSWW